MKVFTRSAIVILGIVAFSSLIVPTCVYANEQWKHESHRKEFSAEERQAWAKKHIDREAARLEIKASQQTLWDGYAAAKLDLINSFGPKVTSSVPGDLDAATVAHRHAEQAAEIAQKLSKLADATEKLQSVLSEDQRKVFNQIATHHGFRHHHFGHHGYRSEQASEEHQLKAPANPAKVTAKEKSKQAQ